MKADQAMKHIIFASLALFWSSCGFGAGVPQSSIHIPAQDSSVKVKLTSSMSTTSSKPGDPVTAVVMGPYEGATLEGTVVHASYDTLVFSFHTLKLMNGKSYPIQSKVISLVNSKGIEGQDDLGHRVRYDGGEVIGYGIHTAVSEGSEIVLSIWKK